MDAIRLSRAGILAFDALACLALPRGAVAGRQRLALSRCGAFAFCCGQAGRASWFTGN